MAVSLLKPPNGGFRSETAVSEVKRPKINGYIFNGNSSTDASVRSGVTVMQRPWSFVKTNGFVLVSVCLSGIISAFSKAVNYPKGSKMDLGR